MVVCTLTLDLGLSQAMPQQSADALCQLQWLRGYFEVTCPNCNLKSALDHTPCDK